jgi:hypothetical protein
MLNCNASCLPAVLGVFQFMLSACGNVLPGILGIRWNGGTGGHYPRFLSANILFCFATPAANRFPPREAKSDPLGWYSRFGRFVAM